MHMFSLVPTSILTLLLTWCLPVAQANYFKITQPAAGTMWANGAANLVTWTKGVGDGIDGVDIEMSRISQDGLIFVARDAPTSTNALNIFIQDLPEGDDYFLLFLNSTSGIMYASSSRFSIGSTANATATTNPSVATVSVSGAPNPTDVFATTFPPSANGVAVPGWRALEGAAPQLLGLAAAAGACLLGGAWTLL